MAPKSTQLTHPKPPKKSKPSTSRITTIKFDKLTPSPSSSAKRINPLTAFSRPPVIDVDALSQEEDIKGKRKSTIKTKRVVAPPDDRLWVDRYEPTTEAELAVHYKKVQDVRYWLNEAFDGGPSGKLKKYRRILALTGPAGTAKTTTIRILAREMGFEILEWRNAMSERFSNDNDAPSGSDGSRYNTDDEALFFKFQAFLTRASDSQNIFSQSQSSRVKSPHHIILLEDLPNILHPRTQSQFHAALQAFIDSPPSSPVVIIVSDAGIRGEVSDERAGWGKDKEGVMDIRTVLPRDMLGGPYVRQIGFNPIAPTLLRKALQALLNTHFSSPSSSSSSSGTLIAPPSKEFLDAIVESANGDIRSAVMALQFACVVELPGSKTKGKGKVKGDATVVLEAITRREQSLVLFHLMGKVLYNKRKGDPPNASATAKDIQKDKELDARLKEPPEFPKFLGGQSRRASRVDVDAIYADSPIDSSLFGLYIHQNYTQFCNDVNECEGIADWLSWVDSSGGEAWYSANPHRFHLLTLGTLHSLPSPVVRRGQKIFKPEFFDFLTKEKDAWEGVRDVRGWITDEGIGNGSGVQKDRTGAGWRAGGWSKTDIATELGGVLKARDAAATARGSRDALPPTSHRLFSSLAFNRVRNGTGGAHQLGESEVDADGVEAGLDDDEGWPGREVIPEKTNGGWLENDDIEDF